MPASGSRLPERISPDFLDRLRERFATYPLIQGWDVTIEAVEPGRARMRLGPSPVVLNLMGTVNGGVQATLADMVCAIALSTAFDGLMPFATSDLHIRYLEPAEVPVIAEAEVLRLSTRSAILDCKLRCDSRIVALCTAHFAIMTRKKG